MFAQLRNSNVYFIDLIVYTDLIYAITLRPARTFSTSVTRLLPCDVFTLLLAWTVEATITRLLCLVLLGLHVWNFSQITGFDRISR